jgi:hypothetical protein
LGKLKQAADVLHWNLLARLLLPSILHHNKLFYDKNDTEDDFDVLNNDKKQKIKSIAIENATKICSIIDEQ